MDMEELIGDLAPSKSDQKSPGVDLSCQSTMGKGKAPPNTLHKLARHSKNVDFL